MKGKKQMPRFRRTMLAGHSGRRGRSRPYQWEQGKGPPTRLAVTSRMKSEITREQEFQALKEEARAIETRLRLLKNRTRDIEPGSTHSVLIASVNPVMCVGCGTCQGVCPAGAVSIREIAKVDPKRCTGCGLCVEQCPRGALSLHPLKSDYKEEAHVAP